MIPVRIYENVDASLFRETILPQNEPAILKGVVAHWPSAGLARTSDQAIADYLMACDTGEVAGVYVGPPRIRGRFFYGMDTHTYNFEHGPAPIRQAIDHIMAEQDKPHPAAIYVQSAPVERHMPRFGAENRLDLIPPDVAPRIWIGNGSVTRAHFDLNHNIACVVAGQRTFTLFPPDQTPNLYPGPFERTIGGVPVSMVDIDNPDFDKHPRYKAAADHMLTAGLEAGDAIYIPYGWWHHVRSISPFNVLINYWWDENASKADVSANPYDALYHAFLAIRDMPDTQRDVWKTLFNYYVFKDYGDPAAHLTTRDQGLLGPFTPKSAEKLRQSLVKSLTGGKT
ncbi:cupin-like domain-containing protein [Asticcacaulis machinosus]|uniref:Cupin-like domain-containing protein n=1 Tax=Asticcacaulis machinosus TaxID=2984211 RepID=A0ABT5HIA3_9CAUL|nr:cupin-like domain-containing protein [Asticcacaulis machinosus]MDC7675974.1 cupin-like domain-containing protein [Asticcacaulis machinosus]